jgi:hypothetical protein
MGRAGEPPDHTAPPPPHLPPPTPRESKWLPAIAVLAVILFVTFGGFLLAGDPSAAERRITGSEGTPGEPVSVGPVTVRLLPGWSVAQEIRDPPQLRLTNGAAQLYVAIPPLPGAQEGHVLAYVDEVLRPQASQLSVSPVQPIALPNDIPAAMAAYVGQFNDVQTPLEGEVVAQISPAGTAVLFDGWAPEGQFVGVREDVRTMIGTAEVP